MKQKGFIDYVDGVSFHILAAKKPSNQTQKAIREMVKLVNKKYKNDKNN